MAINCFSCKWHQIRNSAKSERTRLGITDAEIDGHCRDCMAMFEIECHRKPKTCFDCAWKDRNLPYNERKMRCAACVKAFAESSGHDCTNCPWNNPRRKMPTDATLAHCEACMAAVEGKGAMNCKNCKWGDVPEAVRRMHCMKCSVKFANNVGVRNSTNELSNKGQTIISYDNHNSEMVDDRDTMAKILPEYTESRKSTSGAGTVHPAFSVSSDLLEDTRDAVSLAMRQFAETLEDVENKDEANRLIKANEDYAKAMQRAMAGGIIATYEKMKAFVYEMCQLNDMQALLLLSEIRGDKKTDFAKHHNLKDTTVNILFKQIVVKSPIFKEFIILSRGSLSGTRGRKSKDGKSMERVPMSSKRDMFAGVFQPTFTL